MRWNDQLPAPVRLRETESETTAALEALRKELGITHELFVLLLAGSAWFTRRTLGVAWNLMLGMPERERINRLYSERAQKAAAMGLEYPPLPESCNTLEDLMAFVIRADKQFAQPDAFGWGRRLDELLDSLYSKRA